ncbi:MAG: hypothetical protein ACYC99_15605 [Candidatus Geothermincolia bacterium]
MGEEICEVCGGAGCPVCAERPVWDVEVKKTPKVLIEMHMGPNDRTFFQVEAWGDTKFFKAAGLVKEPTDDEGRAFYLIVCHPAGEEFGDHWFPAMAMVEGYEVSPIEEPSENGIPVDTMEALMNAIAPRAEREWELFEERIREWKDYEERKETE